MVILGGVQTEPAPLLRLRRSGNRRISTGWPPQSRMSKSNCPLPGRRVQSSRRPGEKGGGAEAKPRLGGSRPRGHAHRGGTSLVKQADLSIAPPVRIRNGSLRVRGGRSLGASPPSGSRPLPDDQLPAKDGPVDQWQYRTDGRAIGRPADPEKFRAASADFSQMGFPIACAIDGDPQTGWAIHPKWAKPTPPCLS